MEKQNRKFTRKTVLWGIWALSASVFFMICRKTNPSMAVCALALGYLVLPPLFSLAAWIYRTGRREQRAYMHRMEEETKNPALQLAEALDETPAAKELQGMAMEIYRRRLTIPSETAQSFMDAGPILKRWLRSKGTQDEPRIRLAAEATVRACIKGAEEILAA